jgi:hypothetical protein
MQCLAKSIFSIVGLIGIPFPLETIESTLLMPQLTPCATQEVLFRLSSPNNKQKVVIKLTSVVGTSK